MDGSIWSFLKWTESFVLTHLNRTYNSLWSRLRVATQSSSTWFQQLGISVDHCFYARKAKKNSYCKHKVLDFAWMKANAIYCMFFKLKPKFIKKIFSFVLMLLYEGCRIKKNTFYF